MWQFWLVCTAMACVALIFFVGIDIVVKGHYLPAVPVWPEWLACLILAIAGGYVLVEAITLRYYKRRMPVEYHPKKNA